MLSYNNSTDNTTTDRLVLALTVAGMFAAFLMLVVLLNSIQQQLKPGELYPSPNLVKPPFFYVAHVIQMVLLLAAAVTALGAADLREIERGYLFRFGLFMGAVLLMTVRGYSAADLFSTRLVDSTGPFPCLISLLAFIGARRKYWNVIDKALVVEAVILSVMALLALASMQSFARDRAIASVAGILNALYWPAAWIALRDYPRDSFFRHLRLLPILLYGFMSFFTQTRLNFVMLFACFIVYSYLQYKRTKPQIAVWIVGLGLALWLGMFTAIFLRDTSAFRTLEFVGNAFSDRLTEDSRTGQIKSFFDSVRPSELLLGRGALATWDWGRTLAWRGGTDIGYLTLLFYGGVPLLLTYIATHIKPAFTILVTNGNEWQLTAAGIVLLWTLRMLSSSYPALTLDYYPVVFCVGACISRESFSDLHEPETYQPQTETVHARPLVYK